MNCYLCDEELIWGGDHDLESEDWFIETNLSCGGCGSLVLVMHPQPEE